MKARPRVIAAGVAEAIPLRHRTVPVRAAGAAAPVQAEAPAAVGERAVVGVDRVRVEAPPHRPAVRVLNRAAAKVTARVPPPVIPAERATRPPKAIPQALICRKRLQSPHSNPILTHRA